MSLKQLLSIFLISLPFLLTGQKVYAPLGAEWRYEGHSQYCSGYHQRFVVETEVDVQGRNCSEVRAYLWSDGTNSWELQDSVFIWEDAGKVFFLQDSTFFLIYDFTAEAGDTVHVFYPVNKPLFSTTIIDPGLTEPIALTYTVDEVSETEISGQVRKVFLLTQIMDFTYQVEFGAIIEGIGSTSMGIFGEACCYIAKGCFGQIVCYSNDAIDYASGYLNCDFTSATSEISTSPLVAYPNPASTSLTIIQPDGVLMKSMSLHDLTGRILLRRDFAPVLNISGLESGIYKLEIMTDEGNRITGKVLIH